MLDLFETFAAFAHIGLGFLLGYGVANTGRRRWVPFGIFTLLTVVEGVRFYYMGPS